MGVLRFCSPLMFSLTSNSRNIFLENMMTGFIKACLNIPLEVTWNHSMISSSRFNGRYKCNWAPKDVVIKSFCVCGITQTDLAKISATLIKLKLRVMSMSRKYIWMMWVIPCWTKLLLVELLMFVLICKKKSSL